MFYFSDFGSVVVGTTTEATIIIENKGLVRADVNMNIGALNKKLKHDNIFINSHNHNSLPVGRSMPLYITMKPSPQRFKNIEESLSFTLYLQVGNKQLNLDVNRLYYYQF